MLNPTSETQHVSRFSILGPAIDHQKSLTSMFHDQGRGLTILSDSHSQIHNQSKGVAARIKRAIDQLWHTRNPQYLDRVIRQIDDGAAELIVGYWGTNPLADLLAIRKLRPRVKLVLMVLCHPLSLEEAGIARQQWLMRRAAKVLDGFLFPNQEMADFFKQTVFKQSSPPWIILPPCWPNSFQAPERQSQISDEPNVIFIGRTDLSHHTVHAADDIRPLMQGLLAAGIELHHCWSQETDTGHSLQRPFKPLLQAELIAKMSGYDASLIAYNTEVCKRDDRFRLTVPDRLITSVAAGVPIAIPERGYEGAKSYLRSYPAVFTFSSPDDLKRQLMDRQRVADLKDAAWEARERYCAESQQSLLRGFLDKLL
jgi:hypothetical protein